MEDVSLLVFSCDKYSGAWYPFFELLKIFWPNHPKKIYLGTECYDYEAKNLDVEVIKTGYDQSWSSRLYKTLSQINSKYVIFSLEDFFLQDFVKNDEILKCIDWMDKNPNIAVCRLAVSSLSKLKKQWKDSSFRIAESDIRYRLDTQFAVWDRECLMSFIDLSEDPWQFEEKGSLRIKETSKIFLWYYQENEDVLDCMIMPYLNNPLLGYNIHWGKWLWNNIELFNRNGISNVDIKGLGSLSEKEVLRRYKYLYLNKKTDLGNRLIKTFFRLFIKVDSKLQDLRIFGIKGKN